MTTRQGNNLGESELVARVRRRDTSAMRELYDLHAGFLAGVCSRYITDRDEVNDVLQESFIRIFSSIRNFEHRGDGSLRAWMRRIAVNECLKSLRRGRKLQYLQEVPEEIAGEEDEGPPLDGIPPEAIQEMIRRLPDGYRTVFNLFVFEDMSHREIAELLGIRENSSASQYLRARARLAKEIMEYKRKHRL